MGIKVKSKPSRNALLSPALVFKGEQDMKLLSIMALFCFSLTALAQSGSPPYCPGGKIVSTGYESNGCQRPPACVKPGLCPEFSPPLCRKGETVVNMGKDKEGCDKPPKCVDLSLCPVFSPPYCPEGKIVSIGKTKNGCDKAPVCVLPDSCPQF